MIIDVNAYLGSWPFSAAVKWSPARLSTRLAASGIDRAAVSHLDAVFQPEPMAANRLLFAAVRREPSLAPVPVIQPFLANWREQILECRETADVRAVRLIPNYHNYALRSRRLDEVMAELDEAGIKVVLTARLEDERHRYFALAIKSVPHAAIGQFLARFPKQHVLCTGLSLGEILNLASAHGNFSADLSYAEHIALADRLRGKIAFQRLMFGSLAPMVSAHAQTAKLTASSFSAAERRLIGEKNARGFFGL